ncbi:Sulfur carrier protein CysO [subsurface metagenome]
MSVIVNLHPGLQRFTNGQATVKVEGNTVGQCLDGLAKQFPGIKSRLLDKKGKLLNYIDIYVNQESAYPEELAKAVRDGDEIHITLIIAGG